MTSINYSASAASAVRVLQSVNRDLSSTQNRIATGFKVNSAADDASIWRAASSLRSDIKSYESTSASMEYAKGVYQAAAAGADAVVDIVTQIRTVVTAGVNAASGSVARTNAQSQLEDLQAQLKATLADAKMGDVNLLDGTGTAPTIITSFSGSGGATTSTFTATDLDQVATGFIGFANTAAYGNDAGGTPVDYSILTTTIDALDTLATKATTASQINTVIKNISDYSSKLSGAASRIQSSQDLMGKLADIRKSALSSMVDADLESESAKLQALQVKQQLATQALSIANSSGQNILRLFQ